jgi:long-chain acyl-CoA synthetase
VISSIFPLDVFGEREALIDGDSGRRINYRECSEIQEEFAKVFPREKSLIFLFSQNRIEEVLAYLSLINLGHAICLLDARLDFELKLHLVQLYCPRFIVESTKEKWDEYALSNSPLQTISISQIKQSSQLSTLDSELSLLLSTSGTTGSPKMIRLSAANMLSNAQAIASYLNIGPKEKAIASLPIHYSYGLSILHSHLTAGAALILTQKSLLQTQFWNIMQRNNCTSFAGVPYSYAVLEKIGFDVHRYPSLMTMTQAGGRLDPKSIEKFSVAMKSKGGKFFVMYGQTEATARIAYLPPEFLPAKSSAIGIAIPNGKLKIYLDDKEIFTPHTRGEIVYEGPNVMLGYAEKPEDLSAGDKLHGILHTGDLGYFDEECIFYVTGRVKRISKVYGFRVNLDEVEAMARPYAPIAAVSDDVNIYLYAETNAQDVQEACITYLAHALNLHFTTFVWRTVKTLPRTSSGKIDYKSFGSI